MTGSGRASDRIDRHGTGIANIEHVIADGSSTDGGLGYGLGTVNRLMDRLDIDSDPGQEPILLASGGCESRSQ